MTVHFEDDKTFYTETMAKVYANQGRYDAAVRVYRYLLEQSPDRQDLEEALAAVSAMAPQENVRWEAVADLIDQWVRLMIYRQTLQRLRQIRIRPTP